MDFRNQNCFTIFQPPAYQHQLFLHLVKSTLVLHQNGQCFSALTTHCYSASKGPAVGGPGGGKVQYNLISPFHQIFIIVPLSCPLFLCTAFNFSEGSFPTVQLTCNLILFVTVHFIRDTTRNNLWFMCFGLGLVYIRRL